MATRIGSTVVTPLALVAAAAALPPTASGGLLASAAYHEGVTAVKRAPPTGQSSTDLDGTTLPLHQSITAAYGGLSITSAYDWTDDGTTSVLTVASTGLRTSAAGEVSTGSNGGAGPGTANTTGFVLAEPATYTVTASVTVPHNVSTYSSLFVFQSGQNSPVEQIILQTAGSQTDTGTLAAGIPYQIADGWEMTDNTVPNATGTYGLRFTLTAVPEPAAAGLAAVAGVSVLVRRRRRAR